MFKTAVIFVFISSLLVQSGFVSLYTIAEIFQHKSEVKEVIEAELKNGLHNADLTKFSEKDLENAEWEHSKEFFLGDEKYDVIKTENTKNGKVYHCLNDKKEAGLFKTLDKNKKQKTILDEAIKKFCFYQNAFGFETVSALKGNNFHVQFFKLGYDFCYIPFSLRPPIV